MVCEERQHDLGVVVNLADQFVLTEEAIVAQRIGGIGDIDDVVSHALGEMSAFHRTRRWQRLK